ncbi:hypothetical protein ACQRCJ_02570 [Desulfovibrio sp. SGI.102]|uniref:hypothetical protein n=1 Tax=Desulfovibrio sp. SGI.102 TaxID=3420559 RepID=UPI002639D01B|nr:hypothetical protein [uncultured Desulfovibrio sp.]
MLTKDDMTALEAAIRSSLLARKKELSMSDDALGKMAFAFMANPAGKVQALLVGQGAGEKRKPQTLRIGDAMNLCEALGLQWVDVMRQAVKDIKGR